MAGLVKVVRREARPERGEDAASSARPSALGEAFRDACSLLPSLDPAKNTAFKLGVFLGWGVPASYALWTSALLHLPQSTDSLPMLAVFCLAGFVGPVATVFVTAFALSAGFYTLQGRETRSRLRQALVCPFCRDEVARDGTVICARKGCGALYHDECWKECSSAYGGCAIYGCSSRKCREVSAAGFSLRLARLAFAAVLFPPRVARAIASSERESFRSVYRRAVHASNLFAVSPVAAENPTKKLAVYVLLAAPIAIAMTLGYIRLVWLGPDPLATFFHEVRWGPFAFFGLAWGLTFVLPRFFSLPPALAYYTYRSVAQVLRSEVAALARGDAGGGTVLGRLAAGFGKKSV